MYVLHELSSTSILNLCIQKVSDKAAFCTGSPRASLLPIYQAPNFSKVTHLISFQCWISCSFILFSAMVTLFH